MAINKLCIAIAKDKSGWSDVFEKSLQEICISKDNIEYYSINIDKNDWIGRLKKANILLWKPTCMGTEFTGYVKEKLFFIEKHMGIHVVPSFATYWHFESKVAQSYLYKYYSINTPKTIATFDYDDAVTESIKQSIPAVWKKSAGASSNNVQAVRSIRELNRLIKNEFTDSLYRKKVWKYGKIQKIYALITEKWFRRYLLGRLTRQSLRGVAYWQDYIDNNTADLRITIIGDRYAYGFWRNNRPGDFRASGSGLIDYNRSIPEDALQQCYDISDQMKFDSMAYDIIYDEDKLLIVEMSCLYVAEALSKAPGHYYRSDDRKLEYRAGKIPPQKLWVEWALEKMARRENV